MHTKLVQVYYLYLAYLAQNWKWTFLTRTEANPAVIVLSISNYNTQMTTDYACGWLFGSVHCK